MPTPPSKRASRSPSRRRAEHTHAHTHTHTHIFAARHMQKRKPFSAARPGDGWSRRRPSKPAGRPARSPRPADEKKNSPVAPFRPLSSEKIRRRAPPRRRRVCARTRARTHTHTRAHRHSHTHRPPGLVGLFRAGPPPDRAGPPPDRR